jgi:hypothetical protein
MTSLSSTTLRPGDHVIVTGEPGHRLAQRTPSDSSLTWESLALPERPLTLLQGLVKAWGEREKLRALNIQVPSCLLLIGPPTLCQGIVCLLSAELALPLIIPEVRDLLLDEACEGKSPVVQLGRAHAERKLAELFARARAGAPSILFFDPIEDFGPKRGTPLNKPGSDGIVTRFLVEIEVNREINRDLLLLASTSNPDLMDSALFSHINQHVEIPSAGPLTPDGPSPSKIP